jgi:hypothetical protein
VIVGTAKDAISSLRKQKFDLMFLDLQLPDAPGDQVDKTAKQFGSLPANSSVSKPDDQQVYEVLLKMLDRWNAHDIEGYMELYWKSPDLFVIVDSEQFNAWQQLHDSYVKRVSGCYSDGVRLTHPPQVSDAYIFNKCSKRGSPETFFSRRDEESTRLSPVIASPNLAESFGN